MLNILQTIIVWIKIPSCNPKVIPRVILHDFFLFKCNFFDNQRWKLAPQKGGHLKHISNGFKGIVQPKMKFN